METADFDILNHDNAKILMKHFVRKLPKKDDYLIRLCIELTLIIKKNLVPHLLQVIEILELVKDIPHIIRGSSGSSLVCYCLGISPFDPVKEKVSFARFLNDERDNLPDVDMDFPYNRREEVFERINKKWPGSVARISNHLHYKEKSALREAFRIMGHRKLIPKNEISYNYIPEWKDEITKLTKDLLGEFRGYSLHCGGIIIYPNGVPKDLLLDTKVKNQIKYDKRDVEKKGHFKIDILSNRGLAQLLDVDKRDLLDYPETDDNITKLFETGNNLGLTFAESPAMRKVLSIVKPKNIQDVAMCLALIRPAAAGNGRKSGALARAAMGQSSIDIIYDDDAINYIKKLTNTTDGKADMYRKAFAKGKKKKLEFFNKMLSQFGYNDTKVNYINNNLSQLKKYSFCKSHALSYAKLVWALAYQKVYKPQEFWISTLNHCHSMYKQWVHFNQAKSSGIKLTLGRKPWILKDNTLISKNNIYNNIKDNVKIKRKKLNKVKGLTVNQAENKSSSFQFKNFGYWISDEFMPDMYLLISSENIQPLKVKFKGLIACGRIYNKYDGRTFLTIGYDNNRFLDVTIKGIAPYHKYHWVEGEGYLKNYLDDYYKQKNYSYMIKKPTLLKQGIKNNALMVDVTKFNFGWV
jgi:DNA polymerase III alpha subunit